MKIGLDLYGVIANHLTEKAAFARKVWGLDIGSEHEATREAMVARLGEGGYRTFTQAFSARSLEARLEIPLYPEVRETLTALHAEGARFFLVTMRSTQALESFVHTYVWDLHQLPIDEVAVVTADEAKTGACRRLEVAVFLDDNRPVLELLRPLGITLVWANFYHRPEGGWSDPVAHSWREFADIVRAARPANK